MHRPLLRTSSVQDVLEALRVLPGGALPEDAASWSNVKKALQQFVRDAAKGIRVPGDVGEGRGIVTATGEKHFPSAYALLRRLRDLDCYLPVEVWHLGDHEMDPGMRRILTELGARVVDAGALRHALPWRILNGWELKPYAMLHSRFREVLFLDADCTPTIDPTYLFTSQGYKDLGAVFWPDYTANWTLQPWVWENFGFAPPPDHLGGRVGYTGFDEEMPEGYDPPIESGQILVDKARCYKALRLAGFYCEFSDLTFRWVHGDKEAFRMGWRLAGQRYHLPRRLPGWNLHTILQHCPENKDFVLFHHRTQDKIRLGAEGNRTSSVSDESALFGYARDLQGLWGGKIWQNERPTPVEKIVQEGLQGHVQYTRLGARRVLELKPDGTIGAGNERMEQRWAVYEDDGVVKLALVGEEGLTAIATKDEDGIWRGRWFDYERAEFEIEALSNVTQSSLSLSGREGSTSNGQTHKRNDEAATVQ